MERLSLASFLANGHAYHLYVYDHVKHVPAGAILEDASAIIPDSMIFKYKDADSYAGFSNYFRYKLLLERGGWWVDTDVVCLRPFQFEGDYVFASEITKSGTEVVTSAVIKAPVGSELMRFAWETCLSKDPQNIRWGETGPHLMQQAVAMFRLERFRKPYSAFCPITNPQWRSLVGANAASVIPSDTRAIHLWNELWRRAGQDKNGIYPASTLYEQLKKQYDITPESN
jgi:glycosyl transferase-like sugar-binding protein